MPGSKTNIVLAVTELTDYQGQTVKPVTNNKVV